MSKAPRLFVESPLATGTPVLLAAEQAHYLLNVMRRTDGDPVVLFNGRDGEWRGTIRRTGKRTAEVDLAEKLRDQTAPPDIHYCFAPIKRARLDFIAQKATELGASLLQPVLTRYTVAERVKIERLAANAVEAAEQCGILHLPEVCEPVTLTALLDQWDASRRIVFCDEAAEQADPVAILSALEPGPVAVLIGPEGGFAPDEREGLMSREFTTPIPLGPRVMRADTAAVAALALVNAVLGDWKAKA